MKTSITSFCAAAALALGIQSAQAGPNPGFPFYGWGSIVATPSSPIVGEEAHVDVTVTNGGDAPATNVRVKLSFNDWGVTFWGWQEIGEVVIPSIPAGGVVTVGYDHVFETRTHTCLEVLITGADADDNELDNRGQINLEVVNAGGDVFDYNVPIVNNGDEPIHVAVQAHCGGGTGPGPMPRGYPAGKSFRTESGGRNSCAVESRPARRSRGRPSHRHCGRVQSGRRQSVRA